MIEVRINDKLIYQEYENDKLLFEALDNYLNNGFILKNSVYICPLIEKNGVEYLLSFIHIDNPGKDIKNQILAFYKPYEIMTPDYSDTILNVIAGIRENYGYSSKYKKNVKIFDKKYKNCIIMLLDGMGMNILNNNLDKDSFLRKNLLFTEHAIYPSTTAASTTATCNGLTPLESGWTGWANYIRELNREIILFTGYNYFTDEPTGRFGFEFLPWKPWFSDMDIEGHLVNPDFSKDKLEINDVLNSSLKYLENGNPQIQYVYYTEPDSIMHITGPYSKEAKEALVDINKKVEEYASKLPSDTLLIISADHGHTYVEPLEFYSYNCINKYLRSKPSNDSRCIVFRLKDNVELEFVNTFNKLFKNIYKLMKTSDAIKEGYFGDPNGYIHERIEDFLGDYVAFGINKYYFNYKGENSILFKSHHAGITKEEMEVPVIVIRK